MSTDALSLRSRILLRLVRLSPVAAKQLLTSISPPVFPAITCSQAWSWDPPELYYDALTAIANSAFTKAQIAAGDRAAFLDQYALLLSSSAQLTPSAALLQQVTVNDREFGQLLSTFINQLAHLQDGDRAFSQSFSEGAGKDSLGNLIKLCRYIRDTRKMNANVLVQSIRRYYVMNASAEICADSPRFRKDILQVFNECAAYIQAAPVTETEMQPLRTGPASSPVQFVEMPHEAAVKHNLELLKTSLVPGTPEWSSEFYTTIDLIVNSVDDSTVNRPDLFYFQSFALNSLANMATDPYDQLAAEKANLSILQTCPLQWFSPVEWLFIMERFLHDVNEIRIILKCPYKPTF